MGWPVSRRLAAVAVALVLLTLAAGGALGGVFATDTTGSGLLIDAAEGPNGDYADLSDDRLQLDLSEDGGVSNDAVTSLDAVFVVTNDRSYAAPVWISDNSSALRFYDTDTGERVDAREHARNLSAGESLRVGVTVDTREESVEAVESTSSFVVETLVKDTSTDGNESTPDGTENGTSPTEQTATDSDSRSSGGSGGGGGGGQSSGGSASEYTVYNTSEGATVQVKEGVAADPFTAELTGESGERYASGAGTAVTGTSFDLTFDREGWRAEVTHPTTEPQDAPAIDREAVSYFRADAYQVEASAFDRIGVNASVSLPSDADPADVTFYRHTDDGWQRVETTHRGGDRFSADLGGFGAVAVVVESGGTGDGTATPGGGPGTAETTDTPTGTDQESGGSDGTETATAVKRLRDPLTLDSGLGGSTVVVFAAFSLWLAARGRVGGGGGPGGL